MLVQMKITHQQIADAMCSAFEGGSNYWCFKAKYIKGNLDGLKESEFYANDSFWADEDFAFEIECDDPCIGDFEDLKTKEGTVKMKVTAKHLKDGLDALASDSRMVRHLTDLVSENGDADTGDVIFQYMVFGRTVFG